MQNQNIDVLRAAIAALEGQRATLGDEAVERATAPLHAQLANLRPAAGLRHGQVAVLFVDAVGAIAADQHVDAEDTPGLLARTQRRMADIVHAHQGRVLRFSGEGVKAAFGMDQAREDDAERAVRAGLAMLAAGRELAAEAQHLHAITDFAVRVGVHTGDVALGAGIEADNTAMGAAVNIAARMQQSAPPGALRISHDTWGLVRGLFDLEAQPPLPIKGVAAPLQTYLVRGALERSHASVERGLQGLRTPLVGRDAELQQLLDAVGQARATRQLQALTLLGDAGVGKSRLLRELAARLDAGPAGCHLLTLRSQPDGLLRLFGLLRALLATQCGVADTDSAEVARRKVIEGLSVRFAEHGERKAQLIGQLSGLDFGDSPHVRGLDPRSLRSQAFAALRAWLQSLAAGGRLPVLIVEDLHWADDGSLDLLQDLLAHAAELPLALVMTARPALSTRRPDWGATGSRVALSPLAPAHGQALAQALMQRVDVLPQTLLDLVVGRAEGNPYYMEEIVRRLIDDGVIDTTGPRWTVLAGPLDRLRLPGTLVGLLQARLDALPAAAREAARQASIVGHVFWDDALQALDAKAPQALPELQRAAFVLGRDTSVFEGTPERQFDHHLLHQVTYDTLLKAERKLGHAAAARWLQQRTKGRGAEFLAMTGEHAERAGDTALAIDCFDRAGREAHLRGANASAASWTYRAMALLGEAQPLRRFDMIERLECIADTVGDRDGQTALLTEMASLLEQHPDDGRLSLLLFSQALLASRRSDNAESERLSRRCFDVAERGGAARFAAYAQANLAWLRFDRREYAAAREHVTIALPWAGKIVDEDVRAEVEAQVLGISAMISRDSGQFDEARESLRQVVLRGEALRLPRLQLGALDNLAVAAVYAARWDEATHWAERARTLAQSIDSLPALAEAQMRLAEAAEGRGDLDAAIHCHEQSLPLHHRLGNRRLEAVALRSLAGLHLGRADAVLALDCCNRSLRLHEGHDEPLEACTLLAYSALAQFRLGQREPALATVNEALERLHARLAGFPAFETILLRWTCHRVLAALGDARAGPLLEQVHADVLLRAAEVTDASDFARLMQDMPVFRDIVAAHRQRSDPPAAG